MIESMIKVMWAVLGKAAGFAGSIWGKVALGAGLLALLMFSYGLWHDRVYQAGRAAERAEWTAAQEEARENALKAALEMNGAVTSADAENAAAVAERQVEVREVVRVVYREIPKVDDSGCPDIGGDALRVLNTAVNSGRIGD